MNSLHQVSFETDPVRYTDTWAINSVSWFAGEGGVTDDKKKHAQYIELDRKKEGLFGLEPVGSMNMVEFSIASNSWWRRTKPISAYWCPYNTGTGLPGYVDVLWHNPLYRFVFTPAMQGCALAVTACPFSYDFFRVYHHPHPNDADQWKLIYRESGEVFSFLMPDEYIKKDGKPPNAFNFLYYRNSRWIYVTQPQHMIFGEPIAVQLNHSMPRVVKDALP